MKNPHTFEPSITFDVDLQNFPFANRTVEKVNVTMTYEGKSESLILEKNSIQDDSIKISRGDGSMLFTALLMSAVEGVLPKTRSYFQKVNIPRSAFKVENPKSM